MSKMLYSTPTSIYNPKFSPAVIRPDRRYKQERLKGEGGGKIRKLGA